MYQRKPYAFSFSNIKKCVSVITLKLFLTFRDICVAFYSYRSSRFRCNFDGICAASSLKCLSPATNFLIRYFTWPKDFPKLYNYRKTKFCAIFYVRSNFFNILNPFPNFFTTLVNDQRLALLKYVKNYGELKVPFHTDEMYCIEPFNSTIIH